MNARFWINENGTPSKVTLAPGQSLSWSQGGPTDEGWSASGWTLEQPLDRPEWVTLSRWSDGRDCDGRLSRHWEGECHITRLHSHLNEYTHPSGQPDWSEQGAGQRDYSAEAAGY